MTTPISTQTAPTPEQVRAGWDRVARGFDEYLTPPNSTLGDKLLRRHGVSARMRMLDVAAGSGALTLPAARLGAHVVATDISPVMLDRLTIRARDEGLANVETRVMDGHALDLGDDTFDLTASQHGVSLFPDMARAVREMARVTRPGGRICLIDTDWRSLAFDGVPAPLSAAQVAHTLGTFAPAQRDSTMAPLLWLSAAASFATRFVPSMTGLVSSTS